MITIEDLRVVATIVAAAAIWVWVLRDIHREEERRRIIERCRLAPRYKPTLVFQRKAAR